MIFWSKDTKKFRKRWGFGEIIRANARNFLMNKKFENGLKSLIFITVGQSEAATYGRYAY